MLHTRRGESLEGEVMTKIASTRRLRSCRACRTDGGDRNGPRRKIRRKKCGGAVEHKAQGTKTGEIRSLAILRSSRYIVVRAGRSLPMELSSEQKDARRERIPEAPCMLVVSAARQALDVVDANAPSSHPLLWRGGRS